jgi:hypothetical protein
MSFFMWRIPAAPLMSRPPESNTTPLPTRATSGSFGLVQVPADLDQARCPARLGGATDRVDGRIVLLDQGVARSSRSGRHRWIRRSRERWFRVAAAPCPGPGCRPFHAPAGRPPPPPARPRSRRRPDHQSRAATLGAGLVAVEQIGALDPAVGEQAGIEAVRHLGQLIIPGRQARGQPAGVQRVCRGLADAGKNATNLTVGVCLKQDPPALALEILARCQPLQGRIGQVAEPDLGHQHQGCGHLGACNQDIGHGRPFAG